jgi:hypothetical protein
VGDDGVVLTDRERQALAGLAESIGDPWLARQLAGQEAAPPRPKHPVAGSVLRRFGAAAASGWVALLLVLAGAVLAVATFAYSTVVASLGLLVMGVGGWRLAIDKGDVVIRRLSERRTAAPAPSFPPRTPPAAP